MFYTINEKKNDSKQNLENIFFFNILNQNQWSTIILAVIILQFCMQHGSMFYVRRS